MHLGADEEQAVTRTMMFGTLQIEGGDEFYAFYIKTSRQTTWLLTTTTVFQENLTPQERQDRLVALVRTASNGVLMGYGKTFYLTTMLNSLNAMMYKCVNLSDVKTGFMVTGKYTDESGNMIDFQSMMGGAYQYLNLSYEGYALSMNRYNGKIPVKTPTLERIQDRRSKAAVVANLGIKTAASLFRTMGDRLDWYKQKSYTLIDSNEKFQQMMLDFLRYVQDAANNRKRVLVGLDTETTGLNMVNLSHDNPMRDTIVSIPFAWKDNEGYVICTDMYYFSNVDDQEVYPLFQLLFRRNEDYSFQHIEFDYCGEHFSFRRENIAVGGFNAFFDMKAFRSHDFDIFFE